MATDIAVIAVEPAHADEAPQSAVSWAAILAGASVAVATQLTLGLAASGLGYIVSTPGFASRAALAAFTPEVGAGSIVIQVLAFAFGGYIAGRLRSTWLGVHGHETHFRDTAHGLLVWASGTLVSLLLAALVLIPYAEHAQVVATNAAPTRAQLELASDIAAQSSLFMSIGLLLSGFVAAVAARLGGMEHEAWAQKRSAAQRPMA